MPLLLSAGSRSPQEGVAVGPAEVVEFDAEGGTGRERPSLAGKHRLTDAAGHRGKRARGNVTGTYVGINGSPLMVSTFKKQKTKKN